MNWRNKTEVLKYLDQQQQKGLIQGYTDHSQPLEKNAPKKGKAIPSQKRNKTKEWVGKNLWYWCQANKLTLETEVVFHPDRKWRFDFFIKELKTGIEYNGIVSEKSRHTSLTGYTGDMDKLNAAQALGFKVLQFTPLNHKNLINELNKLLNKPS